MEVARHSLLLAVIEKLHDHGSWTGKTHLQKATFLLDATDEMEAPFAFVLYKHDPYSFDIETELEEMRSYAAIDSVSMPDGFGVVLQPAQNAEWVKRQAPLNLAQAEAIERVCAFVGPKNVTQLERIATAAWIRSREKVSDPLQVATRLHQLKPHISVEDAMQADREFCCFRSAD